MGALELLWELQSQHQQLSVLLTAAGSNASPRHSVCTGSLGLAPSAADGLTSQHIALDPAAPLDIMYIMPYGIIMIVCVFVFSSFRLKQFQGCAAAHQQGAFAALN